MVPVGPAPREHVRREIASFTTRERASFIDGYRRSGRYRPMILAKLEEAGLPSQLSWLPMVESWFKVRAYSRASAVGMWQFISSTGLRYGLTRDGWTDERDCFKPSAKAWQRATLSDEFFQKLTEGLGLPVYSLAVDDHFTDLLAINNDFESDFVKVSKGLHFHRFEKLLIVFAFVLLLPLSRTKSGWTSALASVRQPRE